MSKSKPFDILALTISQPYASLIADGKKWVENRNWYTAHRGLLLIHAGKGTQYLTSQQIAELALPTGAIVAMANLVACVRKADVKHQSGARRLLQAVGVDPQEFLQHEHTEGPWCFVLQRVVRLLEPIPCRGGKMLWKPDTGTAVALGQAIKLLRDDMEKDDGQN